VADRAAGRAAWLSAALAILVLGSLVLAPASQGAVRVWAVGDGGVEGPEDDHLAAQVGAWGIDRLLYLGDVYDRGSREEYDTQYAPGWGRFRAITRPTPGNHEWDARDEGYAPYWGDLARGPGGSYYYAFDIGAWHFVSLNSHEDSGSASPQVVWLRRHLDRYAGTCTIASWHRPRYSAGGHSDATDTQPFWDALSGRATVVLNGHAHNYQRMHPVGGLTQFVVGTGGRLPFHSVDEGDSRLAFSNDESLGALRLALERGRLQYAFLTTQGSTLDSGALGCKPHRAYVQIRRPGRGPARGASVRVLSGRARAAAEPVRLVLVRRAGGHCTAFDGRRFRRSSCSATRSFSARGRREWRSTRFRRGLPRGAYRLTASTRDPAGRRGADTVRFRVRR